MNVETEPALSSEEALGTLLVFVGSLDPAPDPASLRPFARRAGRLRLAAALDHPGERRLGAVRLLASLGS